jgi:hypothetical protein
MDLQVEYTLFGGDGEKYNNEMQKGYEQRPGWAKDVPYL